MKIYLCILATLVVLVWGWTTFLNTAAHIMQTRSNVRLEQSQELEMILRHTVPGSMPSPSPSPTGKALRF